MFYGIGWNLINGNKIKINQSENYLLHILIISVYNMYILLAGVFLFYIDKYSHTNIFDLVFIRAYEIEIFIFHIINFSSFLK